MAGEEESQTLTFNQGIILMAVHCNDDDNGVTKLCAVNSDNGDEDDNDVDISNGQIIALH